MPSVLVSVVGSISTQRGPLPRLVPEVKPNILPVKFSGVPPYLIL